MYKSYKKFSQQKASKVNQQDKEGGAKGKEAQGSRRGNVLLESSDFVSHSNMKTVFISASPVLVNEVNRYYSSLKQALVDHLKKKE